MIQITGHSHHSPSGYVISCPCNEVSSLSRQTFIPDLEGITETKCCASETILKSNGQKYSRLQVTFILSSEIRSNSNCYVRTSLRTTYRLLAPCSHTIPLSRLINIAVWIPVFTKVTSPKRCSSAMPTHHWSFADPFLAVVPSWGSWFWTLL